MTSKIDWRFVANHRSVVERARVIAELTATLTESPVHAELRAVHNRLSGPLRIAVGGRLKAGKSTLVNALVGRQVAPTAAGECTKVVSWFAQGDRDRIVVHTPDGRMHEIPPGPGGAIPTDLGVPAADIHHVDVDVSRPLAVGPMVILDTPGLFSLNDEYSAGSRRAMGLGNGMDDGSRGAVGQADALLYLMPHPGDTDVAFLEELHQVYPASALSAASVVGVLSKIDQLEGRPGAHDPWPGAHRVAQRKARQMRRSVRTVVPVAGLLAETALGGSFTERDAAAILRLARFADRRRLLTSVEAFLQLDVPGAEDIDRRRLLDQLHLYGMAECFRLADGGARNASDLLRGLRAACGIDELLAMLGGEFVMRAELWRAWAALDDLERLSYRLGTNDPSVAAGLRGEIEAARLLPESHQIAEMSALRSLEQGTLLLPPERERELLAVTCGTDTRSRLGLPPNADQDAVEQAVDAAWRTWRDLENDDRLPTSTRSTARVIRRSFELFTLPAAATTRLGTNAASAAPNAGQGR